MAGPVRGSMRTAGVAIASAALVVAALFAPGVANAKTEVYANSEQAEKIAEFTSARCKVRRLSNGDRTFHATAKTEDRSLVLSVDIYSFRGFDKTYNVPYGVIDPSVNFESARGSAVDFSNNYEFPGTPPGGAGAIAFAPNGRKLSLGIYALPNQDYSQGVAIAGPMRCRYRR